VAQASLSEWRLTVRSGDALIALQVIGEGPPDVVLCGPASHLDLQWEDPGYVRAFERCVSFARLITFDRRGTGLADPFEAEVNVDHRRAISRRCSTRWAPDAWRDNTRDNIQCVQAV
jgi:hypothetical protein